MQVRRSLEDDEDDEDVLSAQALDRVVSLGTDVLKQEVIKSK